MMKNPSEYTDLDVLNHITSDEVRGNALATNLCLLADESGAPAHHAALAAIKSIVSCAIQQINNPEPAANDAQFDAETD